MIFLHYKYVLINIIIFSIALHHRERKYKNLQIQSDIFEINFEQLLIGVKELLSFSLSKVEIKI